MARAGIYPGGISADVTPQRLERYFTHSDKVYRIRKEIRDLLVFATQNLIKESPVHQAGHGCMQEPAHLSRISRCSGGSFRRFTTRFGPEAFFSSVRRKPSAVEGPL